MSNLSFARIMYGMNQGVRSFPAMASPTTPSQGLQPVSDSAKESAEAGPSLIGKFLHKALLAISSK